MRTQEHYGEVKASQQAGAVTYFGFLSVFPMLALAFFVVGYVAKVFPDAQDTLVDAIESMFPGMIGDGRGPAPAERHRERRRPPPGSSVCVGVLYAGLGWLSALRDALIAVFELPEREQPNFVMGKVRDLITLVDHRRGPAGRGRVHRPRVRASRGPARLGRARAPSSAGWSRCSTIALGLLANTVLFFAMFRLLAAPDLPARAMWSGALLGAVGFEILKQISERC